MYISVFQDAKCCVWNSGGAVVHSFRGHRGKSIWSLDVCEEAELVVTGGGDGAICLWKLDGSKLDGNTDSIESRPLIPPADLVSDSLDCQFMPRIVKLFGPDHVLIMTDSG